jgi:hypothetical protein
MRENCVLQFWKQKGTILLITGYVAVTDEIPTINFTRRFNRRNFSFPFSNFLLKLYSAIRLSNAMEQQKIPRKVLKQFFWEKKTNY